MERRRKLRRAGYRDAVVILPENVSVPEYLEPPDLPGDFPEPHSIYANGIHSFRSHARAHHRIEVMKGLDRDTRYIKRHVQIRRTNRNFEPFASHITEQAGKYRITNHFKPDQKVDKWANERHRDWKHRTRRDRDDSRADVFRTINYSDPDFGRNISGALRSGDIGIIADTIIALNRRTT